MAANYDWNEFADRGALETALAGRIAQLLSKAVETRGQALIAVSGGTTPKRLFQTLSGIGIVWDKVIVTLVDERFVPASSPRSNAALVAGNLLQNAASAARFVPLYRESLSIEDASGVADAPLRPIGEAVERLRAARTAIDQAGGDVLLVGRAENFFVGVPDLQDTLRRLRAYAEAGADVLYAPGISTREQISAVVAAAGAKPVNLLVGGPTPLSLQDIAALGVRRVSLGGALARAAWAA